MTDLDPFAPTPDSPADAEPPRVLIPPVTSPPEPPPVGPMYDLGDQAFGAGWRAQVIVPPGVAPPDLLEACRDELSKMEAVFSRWSPTSEISRFNAAPAGTWELSETLWDALMAGLDLGDDTAGAFDPTLGALIDLWGFGPAGRRPVLTPTPSDAEIAAAVEASGWTKLRLNRGARAAVQPGGMKLDLSGMAKGLALERLSRRLSGMGATSHVIDFDGDVKARGIRSDGRPWSVALPPFPGPATRPLVVGCHDLAVSTSTVFRKGFRQGERIVSHLIDGRSGRAIDVDTVGVTVLHPNATRADALSTGLMVMGRYEGFEWAEAMKIAAVFTNDDPRGRTVKLTSAAEAMAGEG
ncbi:MAG TPA: FAD:protein FMN transferase [Brevundimonas sp.]|uniref:FAD:protein FMN transferase n=1 Tax=Brevundimonas sp. TaxID=1871086 RepID=UPI002DF4B604|nr:FAD:protein FMN transferase [Brevundimonas sp.]